MGVPLDTRPSCCPATPSHYQPYERSRADRSSRPYPAICAAIPELRNRPYVPLWAGGWAEWPHHVGPWIAVRVWLWRLLGENGR